MKHIEQQLRQDAEALKQAVPASDRSMQHDKIMSRLLSGERPDTVLNPERSRIRWPLAIAASVAAVAVFITYKVNELDKNINEFYQLKLAHPPAVVKVIQELDSDKLQQGIENQLMAKIRQEQQAISADVNYLMQGLFVLNVSR